MHRCVVAARAQPDSSPIDRRRSASSTIRSCSGRGGSGIINLKIVEKNGKVVGIKAVKEDGEIMLISIKGMIVRVEARGISNVGRSTQGVKVINLKPGDKLTAVASVLAKEEEPEEE